MSISKTSLSTGTSLSPSYTRCKKHPDQNDYIIIEDITGGQFTSEITGQPIWLKVTPDGAVALLSSAPDGVTDFSPSHSDWANSAIYIKGNEALVIRYSSSPITDFSNAREVTQYLLGANDDILYFRIDIDNNLVTAYY